MKITRQGAPAAELNGCLDVASGNNDKKWLGGAVSSVMRMMAKNKDGQLGSGVGTSGTSWRSNNPGATFIQSSQQQGKVGSFAMQKYDLSVCD